MATPNAAGTAALIREYITEVAQRPEPQGALVKALMILGARDVGTRDIPNMDEGWGRIDLKGTLLLTTVEEYGSMIVQYYLQLVIPRAIHSILQLQIRRSKQ